MQSVLVITISGPDRAGLVEILADVVAAHRGNWEHCRMAHLAGRFVGLLQVTVPGEQQQDLEAALRTIKGLDVLIAAAEGPVEVSELCEFDLEVVGSDHPGIVRDVFRALAAEGLNVEKLSTQTINAPESGGVLFEAKAQMSCSTAVDREHLRQELEQIAQDIMVDIKLLN